jgi:hypothetical protein
MQLPILFETAAAPSMLRIWWKQDRIRGHFSALRPNVFYCVVAGLARNTF